MLYRLFKKCLVFGTILFFLAGGLGFPCDQASQGDICVVFYANPDPGQDPWKTFDSIQEAIDDTDTENGDKIIVGAGSCIHERITVDKSLIIQGEVTPTASPPIIDGQCGGDIITITADGVTIENFIIENYDEDDLPFNCGSRYAGIKVESDNNIIRDNEIRRCHIGVYIYGSITGNEIYDNLITCNMSNYVGIFIVEASDNLMHHNTIIRTDEDGTGIELNWAYSNDIYLNTSDSHQNGFLIICSGYNTVLVNQIKNNQYGIYFCPSSCNNYYSYNFYSNNTTNVYIDTSCSVPPNCGCN